MTMKRVRASNASIARKRACGKRITVSKVNYIPGTKKGNMRTYAVFTHKKKR